MNETSTKSKPAVAEELPPNKRFLTCFIPSGVRPEDKIGVRLQIENQVTYIPRDAWVTYPLPFVLQAQELTVGEHITRKKFELKDYNNAHDVPTGETQNEYDCKDLPALPGMQVREPTEAELKKALKRWPHGLVLGKGDV